MAHVIVFLVSLVIGVLVMKGSIRLIDGYNHKNSWGAAIGWTLLFSLVGFVPVPMVFGILFLVAYVMVLTRYYEIGALRTVLVIITQIVGGIGLSIVAGAALTMIGVA